VNRARVRLVVGWVCVAAAVVLLASVGLPERAAITGVRIATGDRMGYMAPEVGALAPAFTASSLDGSAPFVLSETRGRAVVLNFWATWCAPCLAEMPDLDRLARAYADEVRVVGINLGEPAEPALAWAARLGIGYALVSDADGTLSALYALRGQPTTVFIGRDGTIRHIALGALGYPDFERIIAPLLG
jgi:thiol-disulfide isomerase/thioredoxin